PHYLVFPTPHFGVMGPHNWYISGLANVLFCDGHAEPIHWKNNWLKWDNLHVTPRQALPIFDRRFNLT
ncbi:MAG: hypothetical protein ABIF71_09245, partial [Planctomycetota bacterium]